ALTRARDRIYLTSAGKIQYDIALLLPGLAAAGVALQMHDSSYVPANVVRSGYQPKTVSNVIEQVSPVAPQFDSIPVTGLVEYTICPKRFKYAYVDGHPGVGEGASGNSRTIGTLTHTALELGIRTATALVPFADGASGELIDEAVTLAKSFDDAPDFARFKLGKFDREVPVSLDVEGITLSGKADLV